MSPHLAVLLSLASPVLPQSGPPRKKPRDVGIAYDIVACRMPATKPARRGDFPDASNHSLRIGRGTELVLIHPDGSEEVLYSPGPKAACADPWVSFDGRTLWFVRFDDPQDLNPARGVSRSPSHIFTIDTRTRKVTQVTFGRDVGWRDTAHKVDPRYAAHDLAPIELADGRILFLSTRSGDVGTTGNELPAPAFWRMNPDGTNLEKMERFSLAGCQHPFILADGRIVWTHGGATGRRRFGGGNYALLVAGPDLSNLKAFAGMHYGDTAWHFATQLADGDIVTTVYYQRDNYGHGTLVRFPAHSQHVSGNDFHPVDPDPRRRHVNVYGQNDHYRRVGERLATPWSLGGAVTNLAYNASSVRLADGTLAGKSTMPAAAPGGNLLFIWSNGRVNARNHPRPEGPHMKICFMKGGMTRRRDEIVVLKESATHHYLYPKPLVPYAAIHGVLRPALIPDVPNDGKTTPVLPAGSPFATTGTSSLYNRESHWPPSYADDWDPDIAGNYAQDNALAVVGQDTYRFDPYQMFAAQVVVDMTRVDVRYARAAQGFVSHNNRKQIWGILGEIPVRKENQLGQVVRDPNGDADTSYEVRIPANTPFHNRIIDWNGLTLTSESTWHSARPGERKNNCGGCHAHSIEKNPLPFSLTAAGRPSYKIVDFALQTPIIDKDARGDPKVTVLPQRLRIVEYHRDVKPIFRAKCMPCHRGPKPKGGLDLFADDAWRRLAYDKGTAVRFGVHQATRWIRKNAATQSLLVWKLFGRRLDGRRNGDRVDELRYEGDPMPPPASPQLTFAEKRTIGMWVDLGCLVDLSPGKNRIDDPFDDQMPPTLVVSGVRTRFNEAPLPPLRLGLYDLHSGIDPRSLRVVVTPAAGPPTHNLAAALRPKDGDIVQVRLPALAPDRRHRIDIQVADLAGNVARRRLDVTPLSLRYTQTAWQRGGTVQLRVAGGRGGEDVHFLANLVGLGRGPCVLGGKLCLDLLEPFVVLGTVRANASGAAVLRFTLPRDMPLLTFYTQAVAARGTRSVKSRPLGATVR